MIDFIFVVFFMCFPILIILLMNRIGLSLLVFSLPSFVIISMFARAYMGILPLYFGWDQAATYRGVHDQWILWKVLFFSSYSIILMVFGFAFTKYVLLEGQYNKQLRVVGVKNNELLFLLILLIVCLFVLVLYLRQVNDVALFVAIFESAYESEIARSLMGNDFSGKYHRYSYFMHDLLNITSFSLYALLLIRRNISFWLPFSVAFLCASFTSVMAVEKAPFMWLLIGHFIVYTIVKFNGVYPIRRLMKLICLLTFILIVFYLNFSHYSRVSDAINAIISRLFAASIAPSYFYIEYFPNHHPFLLGGSFSNPGGLLPFKPYNLTVEIFNWMEPRYEVSDVIGTAPTVYWAEMYANFGVVGVLVPPFFVGIMLSLLNTILASLRCTPLMIGFVVWAALHYRILSISGLSSFIIDIKFLFIASIVAFFSFVMGRVSFRFN